LGVVDGMVVSPLTLSADLVPAGVALCGVRLPIDADAALAAIEALAVGSAIFPLPDRVTRAVPSRRASFLAGRWCAHEALRASVPRAARTVIGMGEFREPLWPVGTLGSIAHTTGYALAAAAPVGYVRAIGVDVERWLDDDAPDRIGANLAGPGELDALIAHTRWPAARLLTMLFSAKESIYKCLYPGVRQYFGFEAAWLERVEKVDGAEGRFTARLTGALGAHLPAGFMLHGRFVCLDDAVVTVVVLD
jgi:4'-phosphopantetheinyl transferase EntD